jgi:hypothetical protein
MLLCTRHHGLEGRQWGRGSAPRWTGKLFDGVQKVQSELEDYGSAHRKACAAGAQALRNDICSFRAMEKTTTLANLFLQSYPTAADHMILQWAASLDLEEGMRMRLEWPGRVVSAGCFFMTTLSNEANYLHLVTFYQIEWIISYAHGDISLQYFRFCHRVLARHARLSRAWPGAYITRRGGVQVQRKIERLWRSCQQSLVRRAADAVWRAL